jgi:hypothetical protein
VPTAYHDHEVKKIEGLKFFACPLSTITGASWELIKQVNICCNSTGDIIHLPEPAVSILEQSPRFMAAVDIIRRERNSDWFFERRQKWAKNKS